jgi:serine protease Do
VSVGPADDVLRAQLRLPEGTGLVVTEVMDDGPAKGAGVEPHDILLSVNGQPVAAGEALTGMVKSYKPGAPPLTLTLLRAGERIEKQVTPQERPGALQNYIALTDGGNSYRIGVDVSAPDDTLRKQLRLAEGGLVVTAVTPDSPAARQGLKVNDVLLSAGAKALREQEDLSGEVRRAGAAGTPLEISLLRGGVALKISVAPEKQPAPAWGLISQARQSLYTPQELTLVRPGTIDQYLVEQATPGQPVDAARRLQQMNAQLEELRQTVELMRNEMEKGKKGEVKDQ